ncbi:MAG: DUF1653 domain-containing protein [Lachnospiraceae bacterium]|nr:DUF1653 domain-containing protein [Lachnospiraceae bacterium]
MREIPKPLQIYKHFKGNLYQIVDIAENTETGEKLVIYRSLIEPDKTWARDLEMFMSRVDKEKYPDVTEEYRFTEVTGDEMESGDPPKSGEDNGELTGEDTEASEGQDEPPLRDEPPLIDPDLERFLDAGSYDEKIDSFLLLRKKITQEMLQTVAFSLDISLSGEDTGLQYQEILNYLKTKRKYESDRLH